jgi:putative hydrolase of the HAD superfamily
MLHTIFFDLDNTLYSRDCGVWEAINDRINLYIETILQINKNEIQELRIYCRENYSTSLRGLQSLYDIDAYEYLDFVHDIDLDSILSSNYTNLSNMLSELPQRKIIFTNSDTNHAHKVLNALGISDFFEAVIDVIAIQPFVKPHSEAFKKALSLSDLKSSEGCAFIDDMIENIEQAQKMGFLSILIGDNEDKYLSISDILKLPDLLSTFG